MRRRLIAVALLFVMVLTTVLPASAMPSAGDKGPLWRAVVRYMPSSRLSRQAKGELGEINIDPAMNKLAKELGEQLEAEEWFVEKGTLEHGIDSLYRNVSRSRFNVVEAKSTRHKGVAYAGLLGESAAGEQMSNRWIKQSLRDLYDRADNLARDAGVSRERRAAAEGLTRTIREIEDLHYKKIDKTLVITRLDGCDPSLLDVRKGVFNSVHPNLLQKFDNVIETDRAGRVMHVYPGTR